MKQQTELRPVAVITGASMGIGEALAERFAARFHDLTIVARSSDALERIAVRLRKRYGVTVLPLSEDLAEPGAPERVAAASLEQFGGIDVLINNAGFGAHGDFAQSDWDVIKGMLAVNVAALVELTHRSLPSIRERRGGVINIASTAAFQPLPHMAVYGATKAFVLSFSEALHEELRPQGVRVLAVCPGATKTNFFARAGEAAQVGTLRSVDEVVKTTLDAYDRGEMTAIDGFANRFLTLGSRLLPRSAVARVTASMMKG
jgi:short-subunit dehydrogenase